ILIAQLYARYNHCKYNLLKMNNEEVQLMLLRSIILIGASLISIQSFAYDARSCEIKKQKLAQQMTYAKKYNNTHRIRGLERAMAKVDRKCAIYDTRFKEQSKAQK
uniref:DUF1090 family protein n=2 Tax=Acinetobacter TaxID=469 RepID=UPI001C5500DC